MRTHASFSIKKPATAKLMAPNKNLTRWMLVSLLSLGLITMVGLLRAEEVNPYTTNYKEQNTSHLKSLETNPDTKIYVSNHKEDDNISMLEKGYDMIGSSGFSATTTASDLALQHAKAIKADTVLVYRKYDSAKIGSSKLQLIKEAAKKGGEIDPNNLVGEPEQYHYYASYWAKLPQPLLGVHVIKLAKKVAEDLGDVVEEEPGLRIIAVIKESPAANASILKGDTLLKIGDINLIKADDLFTAVKRYAGQTVPVELERNNELVNVNVALNKRQ